MANFENLSYTANDTEEGLSLSFSLTGDEGSVVELNFPEGTGIFDIEGNLIYSATGSPVKAKLKTP